jgi:hypothetical protein
MTKLRLPIDGVFYFMEEIFKDIPGYDGLYQVSNLGNVKSLNYKRSNNEKILKKVICGNYYVVCLSKDNKIKNKYVHQLVAMAFLNHIPDGHKLVVDHMNFNKIDNRVDNLQLVSQRENTHRNEKIYSSKFKGVYWYKKLNKWKSQININGEKLHLGYFTDELEAHKTYQNKLKEILC